MTEQRMYYVYIMTNKSRSVLYTGVTNSLVRRTCQHRRGDADNFTGRYNCNRLVFFESFRDVSNAIAREKEIKGWRREKKETLITAMNPQWSDLAISVLGLGPAPTAQWREIPKARAARQQGDPSA